MMDVKLIVVGGKYAGKEVNVPGPRFFIGRAEDCQLRPQSEQISRHHAAILLESGFVVVRDLKSRNGTYVNGELIKGDRELKNGDHVKLGPLEFEVELGVSLSGRKNPKVKSVGDVAVRMVESGSQGDLNIFNLLGEEDQSSSSKPIADKPTVHSTPTVAINQPKTDTVAEGKPPGEPEDKDKDDKDKEEPKEQGAKQTFGQKLEQGKKQFDDTSSAAADVLKEFMKRKQ